MKKILFGLAFLTLLSCNQEKKHTQEPENEHEKVSENIDPNYNPEAKLKELVLLPPPLQIM